jgi:hypothetical protein
LDRVFVEKGLLLEHALEGLALGLPAISVFNEVSVTSFDCSGDFIYLGLETALLLLFLSEVLHFSSIHKTVLISVPGRFLLLKDLHTFFCKFWLEHLLLLLFFLDESVSQIFISFLLIFYLVFHELVQGSHLPSTRNLALVQIWERLTLWHLGQVVGQLDFCNIFFVFCSLTLALNFLGLVMEALNYLLIRLMGFFVVFPFSIEGFSVLKHLRYFRLWPFFLIS